MSLGFCLISGSICSLLQDTLRLNKMLTLRRGVLPVCAAVSQTAQMKSEERVQLAPACIKAWALGIKVLRFAEIAGTRYTWKVALLAGEEVF